VVVAVASRFVEIATSIKTRAPSGHKSEEG
jgi:hypothetical protein